MTKEKIASGTVHPLPTDLQNALTKSAKALAAWNDITPLARNEWICWTVTVKTQETRAKHVKRVITELTEGKQRPCCWIGCIHRKDKAISPSVKWALGRQRKTV